MVYELQVCWQLASRIRTELQFRPDPVWRIPLLCVQWKTPDDGQRNCPKHVEFYSKNKFEKLVYLVGFIIGIYHDAQSPERHFRRHVTTSPYNAVKCVLFNPLTPNDHYSARTASLTSKRCILCIYSTNTGTEYFKHGIYCPFFFPSKFSLFHNSNIFGSCFIHFLYTECAKI